MSRLRTTAPTLGAAFFVLLLQLSPAVALALPAGMPALSSGTRAALSSAAANRALLPWQRQFMRGLASPSAAPMGATKATGADGTWSEMPPPTLDETAAVYDPARESMLLFSGRISNSDQLTSDVWELSLAGTPTWTKLATTGPTPPPRTGHVLLFDSRRERLLLFGGADSIVRNDCWALDLTTSPPEWGQGFPTGTPPARRAYCQAVYDSLNDRAILFGGADSVQSNAGPVSVVGDLWALPLTEPLVWTELAPTGTPPSPRAAGAVLYDPVRQRMVLFGGYDGSLLDDAFTLSLGANPDWADLGATGGPPPARAIPGVIYDAPQDRMVIFAGLDASLFSLNDVWALDLATADWAELSPAGVPPSPRQSPAVVFDAPRNRMVVFGGSDNATGAATDPLWSLSLDASPEWTDLGGRRPPRRWSAATAVDPTRHVMWVHGGDAYENNGRQPRSDLWALWMGSPASWSEPVTTGMPLGTRLGHSAIYDAARDRLVFFGGTDTLSLFNDVWALTLSGTPTWSQLTPSGAPPVARMYHSAVYDSLHDRMVIFGGNTGTGTLNDVWALSLAGAPAWTQLAPAGTPPPGLFGQAAAMDRDANRMIVFGGDGGGVQNRVYALTLDASPAWSELSPTGTPPDPRMMAAMVSLGTRMMVFGGVQQGPFPNSIFNDTWLLSLYPAPSWRPLDVGPELPPGKFWACAGFDQATFSLAVFGGTGFNSGNDTWFLRADQAVPALVSLVSANAQPGRVELAWQVSSALASATVYRSRGDGAWTVVGHADRDGADRLAFVDLDVVAGSRYGYRLGLPGEGGEVFAAEVWVDVPDASRFALQGITPNPGPLAGGFVRFSLPDPSPARLELLDVAGRRVFSQEVGSLGAGEHFVRVSASEPLAPGLYFVRLTREGRSLTAKAVTTR